MERQRALEAGLLVLMNRWWLKEHMRVKRWGEQ
jgi:hypothetical protein